LKCLRDQLSNYCDLDSIDNIKNILSYDDEHPIYQKELYEAVGFSNGLKPEHDLRAIGMLGPALLMKFIEKVKNIT
jgi:hypothetical protein